MTKSRKKKKYIVVITARPSYSRVKTLLEEIKRSPNINLEVCVAASGLLEKFGEVSKEIERDGFKVTKKIFSFLEGNAPYLMAKNTSILQSELASFFQESKPTLVITIADRYETLATAVAASYSNIPLAHIQGGEVSGNIDNKVRNSISQLADYHFPATKESAKRLKKMLDVKSHIYNVGCPSVDIFAKSNSDIEFAQKALDKNGGVGANITLSKKPLMIMFHPTTSSYQDAKQQTKNLLNAVLRVQDKQVLWFWPNADAGTEDVAKTIRIFIESRNLSNFKFIKNINPDHFVSILVLTGAPAAKRIILEVLAILYFSLILSVFDFLL